MTEFSLFEKIVFLKVTSQLEVNRESESEYSYEFVDKFLVRYKNGSNHLEVYELSSKQGKLIDGVLVGQHNKVKMINIEQFIGNAKKLRMQAVSKTS